MSDLAEYRRLIAKKRVAAVPTGIRRTPELNASMFDYQVACTQFALRAGRSALFLDTGMGKSICALDWGRCVVEETNKPVLMLAPLGVVHQHLAEAEKFGIEAKISRTGTPPTTPQIVITNYDRLERFDPAAYGGVILDECFAADTPIDVVAGGFVTTKLISEIEVGDRILNASGVDVVSDIHRREVPHAVRVRYAGKEVITSPNHPFLTRTGWKGASDLRAGDSVLATSEAMRLLRSAIHNQVCSGREDALLRSVLFSEMADATAGAFGESSYTGSRGEARALQKRMVQGRVAESGSRARSHRRAKPDVKSRNARQVLPHIEVHEARTFRAWGQWSRDDEAAIIAEGCTLRRLDSGISFVSGLAQSRISDALQARFSKRGAHGLHRSGWSLAPIPRGARRQERRDGREFRVEGIEVLELGHHDLDRYRDASGKLHFYDLGGTRHPSFSVHGALVHNSSVLKSFSGVTTRKLIDKFAQTPFRLCCSATPAPNDHTELGQHSEFLSVLSQSQMLVRWFLHDSADTGTWRLKGHAVQQFWDWVASWARCLSKPSDLGFSDAGFDMPALNVHKHIVEADRSIDTGAEKDGQFRMFRLPDTSATSIHKEKRLTSDRRAQKVAELMAREPDEPWIIWVDTDYDADALKAIMPHLNEVKGSQSPDVKEDRLNAFTSGAVKNILTKPSIAGFGLNWQHCARMAFMGISFSYENYYQAIRRCWRFRQKRVVEVHIVCADTEASIWDVVSRKSGDHDRMKAEMSAAMARAHLTSEVLSNYNPNLEAALPAWL